MIKVFIDGRNGTTGLKIDERMAARDDVSVMTIPDELRKDPAEKKKYMNDADVVFLCLDDKAAMESVALVENPDTIIIDASTAHRTNPDWVYGFPELCDEQREAIANSNSIANPGCHATGFISVVYPLIVGNVVSEENTFTCFSITGYSGGGKNMIKEYESDEAGKLDSPMPYGLANPLNHKHLPEMKAMCRLKSSPIFVPVLGKIAQGMNTMVAIDCKDILFYGAKEIHEALSDHYAGKTFVKVMPLGGEDFLNAGRLDAQRCNGTNNLEISVFGRQDQALVCAVFDNLGKGASGAAIQNMNIALGIAETKGLVR
ncbi:MAG: N-acetyl-gamma-glutamyl-phosphate reductase [Rickettsiales bacterium]|jgi:N-acetyl-gamma-glutamyl-phosphate reductase|nr:N-acetyl-gamma-glutamyl-phosphate reductase [Rickettsiales bacterium]